jgi:uncharacterized protein (DUF2249 family)
MKVLTHRPRYIEPATVPEFVGETSSATEAKEPTPLQNIEESAIMPEMEKMEEPRAEETKTSEILSPSARVEVPMPMPRAQKDLTTTPKRKRMVNVLDVLETIKSSSSTSKIAAEVPKHKLRPKLPKVKRKLKLGFQSLPRGNSWKLKKKQKKNLQKKFYLRKPPHLFPKHLPKFLTMSYVMLRVKI